MQQSGSGRTIATGGRASAAPTSGASTRRSTAAARPGWSPPRSSFEKDHLVEKLVHDNEILMKEVAELDATLQQTIEEREAAVAALNELRSQQRDQETTAAIAERLVNAMDGQIELVRSEREEAARLHAEDKEALQGTFRELEAQLSLARTEREEAVARGDRERRVSAKRIRELEEQLNAAHAERWT